MPSSTPARPNIVLIHWHDTGRYLSPYGAADVPSPTIAALCAEGVRFERAYSTAPLCSPARGAIFTGRYPHSNGLMGLAHLGWEYHSEEITLPLMLCELGYRSTLIGLQHESSDATRLGFDEIHDLRAREQYAKPVGELASIFIRDRAAAEQPFFLTVGFFEPHRPYPRALYGGHQIDPAAVTVPEFLPDTPEVREDLADFQAAIRVADASTAEVLRALRESGLDDSTIVVFTTDHGMAFPGAKSSLHEAGIGVAMVIRLAPGSPGRRAESTDRLFSHVDIAPTLVELAGGRVDERVQGVSHAGWLRGDDAEGRAHVYAEKNWHDPDDYDPVRAVRDGRYAYIRSWERRPDIVLSADIAASSSARSEEIAQRCRAPRAAIELYDMRADPAERRNLAGDPGLAETETSLAAALARWQEQTADPLLSGPIARPRHPGRLQRQVVVTPRPDEEAAT